MQNYIAQFFETIISGRNGKPATALVIPKQLEALWNLVEDIEGKTNVWKDSMLAPVKEIEVAAIQNILNQSEVYQQSHQMQLHIKTFMDSSKELDTENENTLLVFKEVVKTELTQLFSRTTFLGDKVDIGKAVDKIFDVFSQFLFHNTIDEHAVETLTQSIFSVLDELKIFEGNPALRQVIEKYLHIVLDIVSTVFRSVVPVINNHYADTQVVYNYIRPALPQIEDILKQIEITPKIKTKDISLDSLWEAGNEFVSISEYDKIQEVFAKSRKGIERFFAVLYQAVGDNVEMAKWLTKLKETILHWLTLDDEDFRAENIVELLHFVVMRMQDTLIEYKEILGETGQMFKDFLAKLNALLDCIDNKDTKLLITPKEAPAIHEIYLPDILEPEDIEQGSVESLRWAAVGDTSQTHTEIILEGDKVVTETADEPKDQPQRLTYGMVIDFLCFDKTHGVTAKMDGELADVIHDLYCRDWLSYHLYHLKDELLSLLDKDKYLGYWEEIKSMLLAEKGVNLGGFIDYIIDKMVFVINSLLDFVKETVQYIIDELFKLVKAIIAFFQKVDLPPVARDLLKELPPFKDRLPDNVTLLHVIAAIPYTLYQEFTNFKYSP